MEALTEKKKTGFLYPTLIEGLCPHDKGEFP
jgi:hypothetical protein